MTRILQAFDRELEKLALSPGALAAIQRGLGGLGAGAGIGGLAGAGIGAVQGYRHARQQGAGVGQAALGGTLGGALRGAGTGAAIGGLGVGALQAAGAAPGLYGRLAEAPGALGSAARFGQRQVHALTGWTPRGFLSPEGARQIGAGNALENIRLHGKAEDAAKALAGTGGRAEAVAQRRLGQATKARQASEQAEQMGLTSLPGFAKSIRDNGLAKTMKAGLSEQWHGGGLTGKLMIAGVPAAALASEAGKGSEGRAGRLANTAEQVAMTALGPVPLAGQLAVGAAGAGIHRGIRRLRGITDERPPQRSETHDTSGASLPTERVYSDRASGEVPVMTGAMQ